MYDRLYWSVFYVIQRFVLSNTFSFLLSFLNDHLFLGTFRPTLHFDSTKQLPTTDKGAFPLLSPIVIVREARKHCCSLCLSIYIHLFAFWAHSLFLGKSSSSSALALAEDSTCYYYQQVPPAPWKGQYLHNPFSLKFCFKWSLPFSLWAGDTCCVFSVALSMSSSPPIFREREKANWPIWTGFFSSQRTAVLICIWLPFLLAFSLSFCTLDPCLNLLTLTFLCLTGVSYARPRPNELIIVLGKEKWPYVSWGDSSQLSYQLQFTLVNLPDCSNSCELSHKRVVRSASFLQVQCLFSD